MPKGWVKADLSQIADIIMGQSPPSSTYNTVGRGLPFFQGKAEFGPLYPTPAKFCDKPGKIAEKDDILISVRAPVGPTNLCKETSCIGRGLAAIRANHATSAKFLLLFFRHIEPWLSTQGTGSTFTAISRSDLECIEALLPPLNEQRRILAKMEELLEKVDACQKRLAKIPVILKRFRQAILAAACSGRLTADWREENAGPSSGASRHPLSDGEGIGLPPLHEEEGRDRGEYLPEIPESWNWVKLPDTGEMSRGKSRHRPRNHPSLFGGEYPFIQTGEIAQSNGRITSHKQTYNEKGLAQSRLWPAGTICITIAANIAESAILTYPACFPDSVVGIIADPEVSVAEYVEYFVRVAKADLSTFAPATAQKNINIAILNEVSVPLPPLPEQLEIVRRVEALFTLADQLETRYLKAKEHVDKLTQSILAKAFRGELVPQDENDEPASVLLERIRAQRARTSPAKRPVVPIRPKKRKLPPEPESLPLAAEPPVIYAATIPQRVLTVMENGKEYSRSDIISGSGISDTEWVWAIRQLKDEGKVRQIGERQGARYMVTKKQGQANDNEEYNEIS